MSIQKLNEQVHELSGAENIRASSRNAVPRIKPKLVVELFMLWTAQYSQADKNGE